jgi:hypothetical protein
VKEVAMRTLVVVTTLLLCTGLRPAYAVGDVPPALSARLEVLAPGMTPDHVAETPLAGIYEVRFGSIIIYLSADGRYMLRGELMDLDARRNFTEETRRVARADAVGALGEASMIVFAPDKVKHTITVFTDVDPRTVRGCINRWPTTTGSASRSGTPPFRAPAPVLPPSTRWCRCGARPTSKRR